MQEIKGEIYYNPNSDSLYILKQDYLFGDMVLTEKGWIDMSEIFKKFGGNNSIEFLKAYGYEKIGIL